MRVNEVIGVAGYVLPGTHVDVVATANPTSRSEDITTKVVLSNVEVLAAGTRLEQDTPDGKPMQVTVVTLLVTPDESERLTLASTEGKIQLALRNPLDTESPVTLGHQARHAARQRAAQTGRRREKAGARDSRRRFRRRLRRSKSFAAINALKSSLDRST